MLGTQHLKLRFWYSGPYSMFVLEGGPLKRYIVEDGDPEYMYVNNDPLSCALLFIMQNVA